MASLRDITVALADQIRTSLNGASSNLDFQVEPRFLLAPSEITIDMYPSLDRSDDQEFAAFSEEIGAELVTVRARIANAANDETYDILLDLMDDQTDISVIQAVASDRTLNGAVATSRLNGRSGLVAFPDLSGEANWLGCEWNYVIVKKGTS